LGLGRDRTDSFCLEEPRRLAPIEGYGHRRVDIAEYVEAGRLAIPGWFDRTDARLFRGICEAQSAAGMKGDLLEIGVFQGRTAVLLGFLAGPGERVVASDIFDEPADPDSVEAAQDTWAYRGITADTFLAHWRHFHHHDPHVISGPSANLTADDLGPTFRFVHIDGSHLYEAVRQDIELARAVSRPGAVVALDDIRSPHTPGVSAAAWEAIIAGVLLPVAYTFKLYGAWDEQGASFLLDAVQQSGVETRLHEVRGRTLIEVTSSESDRSGRARWVPPALLPTARRLRQGWRLLPGIEERRP
jgi:hypothetical protein